MGNATSTPKSARRSPSPSRSTSPTSASAGGLDGVLDRTTSSLLAVTLQTLTRAPTDAISFRLNGPDGKDWNERQLLIFFDNVRQALADSEMSAGMPNATDSLEKDPIPSFRRGGVRQKLENLLPALSSTLNELIEEEQAGRNCIGIDFIVHTHIDKVLEELLLLSDISGSAEELRNLARQADVLIDIWMNRLGVSGRFIDAQRMKEMKSTGCYRNLLKINFPPDWNLQDEVEWEVSNVAPGTKAEGGLGFQPGQWWLNMHCCMRDGVVKSPTEAVTQGRYGVTALAMTAGEEIDGTLPDNVIYIRQGFKGDMPFALLGNRQPVRVIRGSRLKSKYAPAVGVRYDGLYRITTYSHKTLDDEKSTKYRYICKVGLHRLDDGQASFETALKHPTPSEVDQFFLYWNDLGAEMREKLGSEKFRAWSRVDVDEVKFKERQMRTSLNGVGK